MILLASLVTCDLCLPTVPLAVHCLCRVPTHPGKSLNLIKEFFRPGKSWKMIVVMESHGKVIEFHQ